MLAAPVGSGDGAGPKGGFFLKEALVNLTCQRGAMNQGTTLEGDPSGAGESRRFFPSWTQVLGLGRWELLLTLPLLLGCKRAHSFTLGLPCAATFKKGERKNLFYFHTKPSTLNTLFITLSA